MVVEASAGLTSDPGSAPNVKRPLMNVAAELLTLRSRTCAPSFSACPRVVQARLSVSSTRRCRVWLGRKRSRLKKP